MNKNNSRYVAVACLNRVFRDDAYSNLILKDIQNVENMSFCTALVYGTLNYTIQLDYIISKFTQKKLDIEIQNILRTAIYQIMYMKVPENAVTDESVKLAKSFKKTSAMSFVNGILRNFLRQPPQNFQGNIKYAVPSWLYNLLVKQYGIAETETFLENSLQPPPSSQTNHFSQNTGNESNNTQDIVKISDTYTLDYSSYLVCEALAENSNSAPHSDSEKIVILDMCAAPGGKTFTISKILGVNAHIFAIEKHKHRAEIMRETTQKLGLSNIEIVNGDSSIIQNLPLADKILCDVPCSGLGVIRRKPEIKFHNLPKELPEIQYKILENSAKFLKKGGELVYSTCTLNKAENEEVVLKFLGEHLDFAPVNFLTEKGEPFNSAMVTILPKYFNSDGFFIAKMTKM